MPGYALIAIIDKKNQLQVLPRFLIAFLFSMLITGLATYALGLAGFASQHIKGTLISIGGLILILYAFNNLRLINKSFNPLRLESFEKFCILVRNHLSHIITFSGFLALVLLSTTYLYGGVIISDQWFHYSRLLTLSMVHLEKFQVKMQTGCIPLFFRLYSAVSSVCQKSSCQRICYYPCPKSDANFCVLLLFYDVESG